MRLLFLLLLILPIIELLLMIKVGTYIGAFATLGLLMLSAVVGMGIIRWQKRRRLSGFRPQPAAGAPPGKGLFNGLLLFFAGLLLIIPGFLTDVAGLLLWLPPVRNALYRKLLKSSSMTSWANNSAAFTFSRFGGSWPPPAEGKDVYEGEFTSDEPKGPPLGGPDKD